MGWYVVPSAAASLLEKDMQVAAQHYSRTAVRPRATGFETQYLRCSWRHDNSLIQVGSTFFLQLFNQPRAL